MRDADLLHLHVLRSYMSSTGTYMYNGSPVRTVLYEYVHNANTRTLRSVHAYVGTPAADATIHAPDGPPLLALALSLSLSLCSWPGWVQVAAHSRTAAAAAAGRLMKVRVCTPGTGVRVTHV